jgi:hypothetical protein
MKFLLFIFLIGYLRIVLMHSYRRFSPVYNPIANAKITCSTPVCTFVQLTARLNYYIMTTRYPLNVTLPDLFRIILICISLSPSIEAQSLKLWYRQPADALAPDTRPAYEDDPAWLSALPLGNGSLGAMVFGDVNKERIQLNEKTLWSGSPSDNNNPEAVRYIDTRCAKVQAPDMAAGPMYLLGASRPWEICGLILAETANTPITTAT